MICSKLLANWRFESPLRAHASRINVYASRGCQNPLPCAFHPESTLRCSRTTTWRVGTLLFGVSLLGATPKFTDIASEAGLTHTFYCGRDDQKDYIIETLGGGVALLDYDRDGYLDAFFVTGSTLEGFPSGSHPSNQLYRNNRDGTFKTVTGDAGLTSDGWGQGACAGDIDNDGFDDLFVTFFGQNHLYRNTGKGRFEDITERSGISAAKRWSTGCAFLDYDRDGLLDLFVANYIVFDKERVPARGTAPSCRWTGPAGAVWPARSYWRNQRAVPKPGRRQVQRRLRAVWYRQC